jgi:hypothetical protein
MSEGEGKQSFGTQSYPSTWEKEASKLGEGDDHEYEEENQARQVDGGDGHGDVMRQDQQNTSVGGMEESGKNSLVKKEEEQNQAVVNRNFQKSGCANCGLKIMSLQSAEGTCFVRLMDWQIILLWSVKESLCGTLAQNYVLLRWLIRASFSLRRILTQKQQEKKPALQ